VLAVIDARRGEAFAAAYQLSDDSRQASVPLELTTPRALAPAALASPLQAVERDHGAPRDWLAVGDGAVRYRADLERAGAAVPPDANALHRVSAAAICAAGARAPATPAGALAAILPDYRRRPDAELALDGADGQQARQR